MEGLKIYVVIGGFSLLADALLQGSSVCIFFNEWWKQKLLKKKNEFAILDFILWYLPNVLS